MRLLQPLVGWIAQLNRSVPLFYKVLIANAALIAVGALAAAWVFVDVRVRLLPGMAPATAILALAIGVSILVNYLLMRLAFHPLFVLRETMDAVRRGKLSARAPVDVADPDIAKLAATFNRTMDELAQHRRSASSVILRALEEERKRIARELHDETSQSLTNFVIRLEMLLESMDAGASPQALREDIVKLRDLAARALQETRRLTFDLRPTILDDLGLVPAIRWLLKNNLDPGLTTEFEVIGCEQRLSDEVETAVFRIVQEALSNINRHAAADHVRVLCEESDEALRVVIEDNGRGFQVDRISPDFPQGRGLGLFGMGERADLLGGRLTIDSQPGAGTRVEAVIPKRNE